MKEKTYFGKFDPLALRVLEINPSVSRVARAKGKVTIIFEESYESVIDKVMAKAIRVSNISEVEKVR